MCLTDAEIGCLSVILKILKMGVDGTGEGSLQLGEFDSTPFRLFPRFFRGVGLCILEIFINVRG
jgi:hypothetical protein